ncbi:MAG TPA: HU family DNA-binding protein [Clostridia bacterium]|jgi:DNA-binding protein HU-beta|nr:HU family DNA-binding protein [Clostridia bacterium]NLF36680.1 HU family DNA-binding protein [Clostridiaceae bacterium]MDD3093076.1 HU family DNA-binding protein [Clostridia bacterium]MDD3971144.1 HU family DNA-binding protein [Clostridia bacterium]HPJ75349.1 HU family DNA-binding protein [Clostridia bacterium]
MNKREFIKAMSAESGLTVKDTDKAYDAFLEVVAKALKEGDKVQLAGFGTFEVKKRAARTGVNPKTGEKVQIKASKAPALRFGKSFKELF